MQANRESIALHEAGHAVMRRVCGLPATPVIVTDVDGETAGTGRSITPRQAMRILLAGIAAETVFTVDCARTHADDLIRARQLLADFPQLRCFDSANGLPDVLSVDDALQRHYQAVCDELEPVMDFVHRLADRLDQNGHLSSTSVAATLRRIRWREDRKDVSTRRVGHVGDAVESP